MPFEESINQTSKPRRKPRKRAIYAPALNEGEQLDFVRASAASGLEDEITLLRTKILSILYNDPENISQVMRMTTGIARLLKTRCDIGDAKKDRIEEAFNNVFRELVVPLGLNNIAGQNKP